MSFFTRLLWSFRSRRHEQESADEMAFHVEMETRDLEHQGLDVETARRQAERRFGNRSRVADTLRDGWRFRTWDALVLDLRFALRTLRARPTFALVVIMTLGVGIGACTTAFGFINAFLLRPMPFQQPAELVHLWETDVSRGQMRGGRVSLPVFEAWRERASSFTGLAAFNYTEDALADQGGAEPVRMPVAMVSANAFRVLGMTPVLGRDFVDGEDRVGAEPVALLSWELWHARYQASPSVLGRTILLEEVPHVVIGVMPPGTAFPLATTRIWRPYQFGAAEFPASRKSLQVAARLAPGADRQGAQAEMNRIAVALEAEYPVEQENSGVNVEPLRDALNFASEILGPLAMVLGVATLAVLLVACANVASLLVARTGTRSAEMAVRAALGAGAGRLSRQLVTETAVLGVLGALAGLLMSRMALGAIDRAVPPDIYRIGSASVGSTEVVVALTVGLLAALFSSVLPARIARAPRLFQGLRDGVMPSPGRPRAQSFLVAAQLALTLALLVGAMLLIQSAGALRQLPLGFATDRVASGKVILPASRYLAGEPLARAHASLLTAVRAGAGITGAATVNHLPLNHETFQAPVHIPGTELQDVSRRPTAIRVIASDGYFSTIGLELQGGRDFGANDQHGSPPVAVVNQAFVARFLTGSAPIGRTAEVTLGPGRVETITVIGVVENSAQMGLGGPPEPIIYQPVSQVPVRYFRIVVAGAVGAGQALADLPRLVHSVDPMLPVDELRGLDAVVDEFLLANRMLSTVLLVLAGSALVLALVGTYGLLSLVVGSREREFGVRLALGASRASLVRGVVMRGMLLVVTGIAAGNLLAVALARLTAGFLYGVEPLEPVLYAGVSLALLLAGTAACVVPALRAARQNPLSALRAPA